MNNINELPVAGEPTLSEALETAQAKKPRQAAFLAAYAECGNITRACRIADVGRRTHYDWLQDFDYREAFAEAHQMACESLEAEARRRATEGVDEPIVYQGNFVYPLGPDGQPDRTKPPLSIRRYSDVLLIFLIKAAMPQKYRETAKVEVSGPAGGPIPTVALDNMGSEQLQTMRDILQAAVQAAEMAANTPGGGS